MFICAYVSMFASTSLNIEYFNQIPYLLRIFSNEQLFHNLFKRLEQSPAFLTSLIA